MRAWCRVGISAAWVLQRIDGDCQADLDVPVLVGMANTRVLHFKVETSPSLLQSLKAVRLHQARLLMIGEGASALGASRYVGCESRSQFSREFKRLFGRSPVHEARHLKALLAMAPAWT